MAISQEERMECLRLAVSLVGVNGGTSEHAVVQAARYFAAFVSEDAGLIAPAYYPASPPAIPSPQWPPSYADEVPF